MRRIGLCIVAIVAGTFAFSLPVEAQEGKWANLKGQIVFKGTDPGRKELPFADNPDKKACLMDKDTRDEDWIINPTNKGIKNVFVWIRPAGAAKDDPFPKDKIHPNLKMPAKAQEVIDQPCCRFIPHTLAAREGQTLLIKNSAEVAHNSKWESSNNGAYNPILPSKGQFQIPKPLVAESGVITLQCSIHPWMKAHVRIFDHPYYAITDADGKFEIKNAPVGKFAVFYWHPTNGWLGARAGNKGYETDIKPGDVDLGKKEMEKNP
jgi:hypothetical protein